MVLFVFVYVGVGETDKYTHELQRDFKEHPKVKPEGHKVNIKYSERNTSLIFIRSCCFFGSGKKFSTKNPRLINKNSLTQGEWSYT